MNQEALLNDLEVLMSSHGPPGVEDEVTSFCTETLSSMGLDVTRDNGDNLIVKIEGRSHDDPVAITAHKDEISMMVRRVDADGRLRVRPLGGLHAWAIGETPVEILGVHETLPGILSIGSKHVSNRSPAGLVKEGAPFDWNAVWIETKASEEKLLDAGVRAGSRVVIDRDRKRMRRLGDFVCGYNLDCRAGIAILFETARLLKRTPPVRDVYLVVSSEEEVGAFGAIHAVGRVPAEEAIALDIAPVAREYRIENGPSPVLLHADAQGLYHEATLTRLHALADELGFGAQAAVVTSYGSDATIAKKAGAVGRAICIAYPGENTHGYEICSVGGIVNTGSLLVAYLTEEEVV